MTILQESADALAEKCRHIITLRKRDSWFVERYFEDLERSKGVEYAHEIRLEWFNNEPICGEDTRY